VTDLVSELVTGSFRLVRRQASFSDVQEVTVLVSREKLQARRQTLQTLFATKKCIPSAPAVKRNRTGTERKDLLFSTLAFWEELRAAVRARARRRANLRFCRQASTDSTQVVLKTPVSRRDRVAFRGWQSLGLGTFSAPTPAQLYEERAIIAGAREALPLLLHEVKDFRCAPGESVGTALRKVTQLLDKIDSACEAAFPTVHSTGRLLSAPCDAASYYSGKARLYGEGGWNGMRSVAVFEPEFCAGSVEDKSTFVSRLEALRAWQSAACISMPMLGRFRREAATGCWHKADLGGLLQRTQISKVLRSLVAELVPAMLAVSGLYQPQVRPLQ
jgi:hypothetical protein